MTESDPIKYFTKRVNSFRFAWNGLKVLFTEEPNARIHLYLAIAALILGFVLKISTTEWLFILFAIGLVFMMETVNTAIENLCDFVSPEKQEMIKKVKDLSAAAVLISAFTAAIIGLLVFFPHLFQVL